MNTSGSTIQAYSPKGTSGPSVANAMSSIKSFDADAPNRGAAGLTTPEGTGSN
jgi:hypothetical protein